MDFNKAFEPMGNDCSESTLEIECPECGAAISAQHGVIDIYCGECKRIVMQIPLVELGST
jgi:ribosomal protein S27AE